MNISELFIRRPVATSLLMAGVVLMGLLGYALLPISALPAVDFPTIQVTAQYPGASPDVMTSSVTTPLERQFGQISGLAMMTSAILRDGPARLPGEASLPLSFPPGRLWFACSRWKEATSTSPSVSLTAAIRNSRR